MLVAFPWMCQSGKIPFQVHQNGWDSFKGKLFCEHLECFGFTCSCGTRNQAVSVEGFERDLDYSVFNRLTVQHACSYREIVLFSEVAVLDLRFKKFSTAHSYLNKV